MPDLRIGKVIFETKKNNIRTIFQLTIDELGVIEEIDDGNTINKTAKSYRIHDLHEYMMLEGLFLELIEYTGDLDIDERHRSRIDYTFNNGERIVRLVYDDGLSVQPWLDILDFIRDKLGIDFTSSAKAIGISSGSLASGGGVKKDQYYFDKAVKDIVDKLHAGTIFTNAQMKERVRATGGFEGVNNKVMIDETYRALQKLVGKGIIVKLDHGLYKK